MGEASATALAGHGATVAILDIDAEAAERVATSLGDAARAYCCDVSDAAAVERTIAAIRTEMGPIAILHNNAAVHFGYGKGDQPAADVPIEIWRRTMAVNLDGTFFMTKFALRHMIERKGGSIINTASIAGPLLGSQNTAYTAAKGGIAGFTRSLVISYAGTGIRANAILPGFVATPMSAPVMDNPLDLARYATSVPAGRLGAPKDIGGLVVFLASDASSYVNGAVITLDGGVSLL